MNAWKSSSGIWMPIVVAAAILLAACPSAPPRITIEGAKAQLSPAIYGEAMVVMRIKNAGGPDVLNGVSVDIAGAKASLHVMDDERMVSVDKMDIPANADLELKMGGSHIMVQDMPRTTPKGQQITLTLKFKKSGEKKLQLTLEGADAMPMGNGGNM